MSTSNESQEPLVTPSKEEPKGKKRTEMAMLVGAGGAAAAALATYIPSGDIKTDANQVFYLLCSGAISATGYLALKYGQQTLNSLCKRASRNVSRAGGGVMDRLSDRFLDLVDRKLSTNPQPAAVDPHTQQVIDEFNRGAAQSSPDARLVALMQGKAAMQVPLDYERIFTAILPPKAILMEATERSSPRFDDAMKHPEALMHILSTNQVSMDTVHLSYAATLAHLQDDRTKMPEHFTQIVSSLGMVGGDASKGIEGFAADPEIQALMLRNTDLCARLGIVTRLGSLGDDGVDFLPSTPQELLHAGGGALSAREQDTEVRRIGFFQPISEEVRAHNRKVRQVPIDAVLRKIFPKTTVTAVGTGASKVNFYAIPEDAKNGPRTVMASHDQFSISGPGLSEKDPPRGRGAIDLYCKLFDATPYEASHTLSGMFIEQVGPVPTPSRPSRTNGSVLPKEEELGRARLAAAAMTRAPVVMVKN
jgi:hypothetical protein